MVRLIRSLRRKAERIKESIRQERKMSETKCDVCHVGRSIGVASTAIPLSVAYCEECARRHAQPMIVFVMWEEDLPPQDHRAPDEFCTYEDGKYISYRKWYNARHPESK